MMFAPGQTPKQLKRRRFNAFIFCPDLLWNDVVLPCIKWKKQNPASSFFFVFLTQLLLPLRCCRTPNQANISGFNLDKFRHCPLKIDSCVLITFLILKPKKISQKEWPVIKSQKFHIQMMLTIIIIDTNHPFGGGKMGGIVEPKKKMHASFPRKVAQTPGLGKW